NAIQRKDETLLWAVMTALTFVVFTAISGKLMSYLMPLTAPLAWWAAGIAESIKHGKKYEYKKYLGLVVAVLGLGLLAALSWWVGSRFGWNEAVMLWPVGLAFATATGLWASGGFSAKHSRTRSLAILWLTIVNVIAWGEVAEDRVYGRHSVPEAVAAVRVAAGLEQPQILTVGFVERSLPYYTNRPTARIDPRVLPDVWASMRKDDLVLLAEPEAWEIFAADPNWDLAERFERVAVDLKLGFDAQPIRVYRTTPRYREP
ncbi:MAG: hypothetical protein AAF086_09555, partial [Planctomycetota bacterium]